MKERLLDSPRAGRILAAVAVGVALVVCGAIAAQSGTTPSLPGLAYTSHPCETAQLRVLIDSSAARHTADGTYLPIDFINNWRAECLLRGYTPVTGVSTTAGHDAHAVHIPGAATSVLLPQDYAAHTWVLIANAAGGSNPASGASGCRRLTASGLRVALPQTTGHLWIAHPFTACAGTGQALLSIRPVLQGLANPATFP
jgi:hypothetical protein